MNIWAVKTDKCGEMKKGNTNVFELCEHAHKYLHNYSDG